MKHQFLAISLALSGTLSPATADQLFTDDVIVQSDLLCVGTGCGNGEPIIPERDGLKIKATNGAIQFVDISQTPGFPDSDWRININETQINGLDAFYLEHLGPTTNRTLFGIEPSARDAALWISDFGLIGLGTRMPTANLHVLNTAQPSIKLEQSGFGGFAPFSWTMRADNYEFTIGETGLGNPFAIKGDTTDNAMVLAAEGLGLGTAFPDAGLHIQDASGNGTVLIEETSAGTLGQLTLRNNGITFFTLEDSSRPDVPNSGRKWNFQNQGGTFRVTTAPGGPGEIEMILTPAGNMTIEGSLTTGGGTCGGGCDAVFSDAYDLPSISEHQARMWAAGHLPNVGPTPENQPINVSDKLGRMLNELEHAHIYIGELHDRLSTTEAEKTHLQTTIADQNARLARLEAAFLALSQK